MEAPIACKITLMRDNWVHILRYSRQRASRLGVEEGEAVVEVLHHSLAEQALTGEVVEPPCLPHQEEKTGPGSFDRNTGYNLVVSIEQP